MRIFKSFFNFFTIIAIKCAINCEAAKILAVVPVPSISHQNVFRPIIQELVKRGHQVTAIVTDTAFPKGQAPDNLTEIDVHDIAYETWRKTYLAKSREKGGDTFSFARLYFNIINKLFDKYLEIEKVKEIIKNGKNKYDLLILESCVNSLLALSHLHNIPVMQIGALGSLFDYEIIGAPRHLLYPESFRDKIYNNKFWDDLYELYTLYKFQTLYDENEKEVVTEVIKRNFDSNVPSLNDLKNNVDFLLLNINSVWEGNRPVTLNMKHIGGVVQVTEKPLPEDLQIHLDRSTNGFLYMSFGTNLKMSALPNETREIFFKTFAEIPYNVLLKWDGKEIPELPINVKIARWFPQIDILRHPNIKAFITHGGLNSCNEAVITGVPMIGIPMVADQYFNTEQFIIHKIGVKLKFTSLNKEILTKAIYDVVTNKRYRHNIVKLRTLMLDQPQSPLERAVWSTEYLLRHGGAKHLRPLSANMHWAEYSQLDLILISSLFITVLILIFVKIIMCINTVVCKK